MTEEFKARHQLKTNYTVDPTMTTEKLAGMMEEFSFYVRREGPHGPAATCVETLPGGENLGEPEN